MTVSGRMKGLIDKIITFYEMRANAMSVLMANTEKALEQFAPQGYEQIERLDNRVKNLTTDLNNMLTRFWFVKERKQRKNESMTSNQVKNLADFADFTKTLANEVRALLNSFEKKRGQTFEKEFDKEVKQMETHVNVRLKGFDKALEEALSGTPNTWKERLKEYVGKGA